MKLPFDPKDIKPGTFSYFTKRKLKNREGEEKGEIILWKKSGEDVCHYIMRCPYCEGEQEGDVVLKRRPYRVKCSLCKKSITLPKLINIK